MRQSSFLVLLGALIAQGTAQSGANEGQVLEVFLLGADSQALFASVIGSDSTATTLAINCPPDTDSEDCGFPSGATVTVGPSTFHGTYAALEGSVSAIPDCKFFGSPTITSGECQQTMIGPQGFITAPGPSITVTTGDATILTTSVASATFVAEDISAFMVPVTITAGTVEQTSGAQGAAETSPTLTSSQNEGGAAASATGSGGAESRLSRMDGVSIVLLGLIGLIFPTV